MLRADDGSVISDQEGLSRLLCSFYADLYSASPCDPVAQAALLSNVSARLSPAESLVCEGPLSQGECFAALQGMARGRTPGCDGLPMEFYLRFWSVLGADLVLVLNSAFTSGLMSRSQRRGIITLSFKKGDHLGPVECRLQNCFSFYFCSSS